MTLGEGQGYTRQSKSFSVSPVIADWRKGGLASWTFIWTSRLDTIRLSGLADLLGPAISGTSTTKPAGTFHKCPLHDRLVHTHSWSGASPSSDPAIMATPACALWNKTPCFTCNVNNF